MCIGNTNSIQRLKGLKTPMYLTIQHWKGLQNELQPTPAPRQDEHSYFILLCSPACKYFGTHLSLSDRIAVFLRHMQTTEILQPSKVNASLPFSFNESEVSFFGGVGGALSICSLQGQSCWPDTSRVSCSRFPFTGHDSAFHCLSRLSQKTEREKGKEKWETPQYP